MATKLPVTQSTFGSTSILNRQKSLAKYLCWAFAISFLSACSSVKKVNYESQTKYWQAKAMIIDFKKDEKHFVDLELFAHNKSKLRINASGPMGISLMSLVLVQDKTNQYANKVDYILPQQKKYVTSPSFERAMRSLLKVNLEPELLFSLLYDEEVNEASLKKNSKIKINWIEKNDGIRKISMGDQKYELQLVFQGDPTNVQLKPKMFHIEPPSHYTHQVIQ